MIRVGDLVLYQFTNLIEFINKDVELNNLLENGEFHRFLFLLDIYRVKDIFKINHVVAALQQVALPNNKDPLYETLVENNFQNVVDELNRVSMEEDYKTNDSMSDFDTLLKIVYENGDVIGMEKTNLSMAQMLGVKASRISEWRKSRKIPSYIEKEVSYVLNIPVWTMPSLA